MPPMHSLFESVHFNCGATLKNRFMLAPLTNTQSQEDGSLGEDEFNWLLMRAKGGFGLTMTCASYIQENGKGFPGQLGINNDAQIPGHKRLAAAIKKEGSLAVIQIYHGGIRSPKELVQGSPVGASAHEKSGSRALSLTEVYELRDNFIAAAVRAQNCGYDGVEMHGAHGYIICQFLSSKYNRRDDEYGGSLENRSRLLFEIVNGIREACGTEFLLGIRLSPERFGMQLGEIKTVCEKLVSEEKIDFLDISLWDCFKEPEDEAYKGQTLLDHFTSIDYGKVQLTVAGKIYTAQKAKEIIEAGVDFVTIGRAAILHHDFPEQVRANPNFEAVKLPVSREYLKREGLGEAFLKYMGNWPNFIEGQ